MRLAVEAMGCVVSSDMTSLVVLNLPGKLAGLEKDLVAKCREEYFGIWPTLSSPVQVRIDILNQLNQEAISDIAGRFADGMLKMGASFNKEKIMQDLAEYFSS